MEVRREDALKRQRNFVGLGFSWKPSRSGVEHEIAGAKAEEQKNQDRPGLPSDFKAGLGNLARLYAKIKI